MILELTEELRTPVSLDQNVLSNILRWIRYSLTCFQVCVFYLVLRGLDTIGVMDKCVDDLRVAEDDMSIPVEKKQELLKSFAGHLNEPGWNSREGCTYYLLDFW